MVRVLVLGELTLEADGRSLDRIGSQRARSLLGWLAVHPGLHPRARVASVFWPDVLDESARSSLRTTLATLRREVGRPAADLITATRDRLGIEPGPEVWVDLQAFEQLMSSQALEQAALLCRGELLEDLDDDWVNDARERHRHQQCEMLGRLADDAERSGDSVSALQRTRAHVALDPHSEEAQRDLLRRLDSTGDRPGALAAYEGYRERLRLDLGITPSTAIRDLVEQIRSGNAVDRHGSTETSPKGPLPAMLSRPERVPMVGREAELNELRSAFAPVDADELRVAIVSGEAGSGKSRLTAEFARGAHAADTVVMAGRCYEDSPIPYGAFVEALRGRVAPARLRPWEVAELSRLLPELSDSGPVATTPAGDPEEARQRLFDAVVAVVTDVSRDSPLALVLEDLHWADHSTLLMLAHLTRAASSAPVLVLVTAREGEPGAERLAGLLAELSRDRRLSRVALEGLPETQVGELAAAWLGEDPPPALAAELHDRTDGNPLFVQELLRHAREAGALGDAGLAAGLPEGVRDVIGQRVDRLGALGAEMLAVAAVIGDEFDIREVGEAGGRKPDELVDSLDDAVAGRLVREVSGSPGRYRFSHDLVRETVYERLSATRRALLHLEVAAALEHLYGDDAERLPIVARHLAEAGPAGDIERTARFALRAAEQALTRLAYEDAAAICRRAMEVAEGLGAGGGWRVPLLLRWGEACLRAGDAEGARVRFTEAAEAAREMQEPDLLARAALGFAGLGVTILAPRPDVCALLEEALAAVPAGSALRPTLLARLAIELYYDRPASRSAALSEEAVDAARRVGAAALPEALNARHVALWGPDHLEERLELADELVRCGRDAGDRESELQGLNWRVLDLVEAGRLDSAREAIDAHAALADQLRLPGYRWYAPMWRAMLAELGGRFEEAKRLTAEGELIGRQAQDENAMLLFEIQHFTVRRVQQTLTDEDILAIEQRASASATTYAWHAFLAEIHADNGREDEARDCLRVGARDLDALPRDVNWLYTFTGLGRAAASVGDLGLARSIYEQLAPYGGRIVMAGRATACIGSASLALGEIADALGRPEAADRHFEQAIRRNGELGARPWLERAQLAYAAMLERRGDSAGAEAARNGSHAGIARTSR